MGISFPDMIALYFFPLLSKLELISSVPFPVHTFGVKFESSDVAEVVGSHSTGSSLAALSFGAPFPCPHFCRVRFFLGVAMAGSWSI